MNFKNIDINHVFVDLENPRIAEDINGFKGTVEEIREHAEDILVGYDGEGTGKSAEELKKSIIQSRGIVEPIIVEVIDENYLCIEGNTRVSIYKDLLKSHPESDLWKTIPAVIHEKLDDKVKHSIRLDSHFVGKKEWKPYDKGKYISKLLLEEGWTMEEIIQHVGGKKGQLMNYVYAYDAWQEHYVDQYSGEYMDPDDFSMFITARQGAIQEALDGNDPINKTMKDFAGWVKNKKLGGARTDVQPYLARVLNNDKAREVFLEPNKTLKDAIKKLPLEDSSNGTLEEASIDELCNTLSSRIKEYDDNKEHAYFHSAAGEATLNNIFLLSDQVIEFLKHVDESSK
tara:strand:+ start:566 stop:1594 length:1029 start_codon:yes stop_codon:yes gene_type:complete